jgi:hypothetical protein
MTTDTATRLRNMATVVLTQVEETGEANPHLVEDLAALVLATLRDADLAQCEAIIARDAASMSFDEQRAAGLLSPADCATLDQITSTVSELAEDGVKLDADSIREALAE